MRRLRKFLNLRASDHYLLFRAVVLLGAIRLGLWLLPFQALRRLLAGLAQTTSQAEAQVSIQQVVWTVQVASRCMPGGVKCLARALTTKVILGWYAYPAELRIGVAKGEAGQLEAHAWVESQGRVVIGGLSDLPRFTPLPPWG